MTPLIDPQRGDFEDDASSTKQRSLFAIAGSLLAEISLPKLIAAWLLLIVLPGILLGLAPFIGSAWLAKFSRTLTGSLGGIWPMVLLLLVAALGWFGGRPLFRAAEQGFWSLNSLAVQPCSLPGRVTASVGASDPPGRRRGPRASAGGKRRGSRACDRPDGPASLVGTRTRRDAGMKAHA